MDRRTLKKATRTELLRELESATEELEKARRQFEHTQNWIFTCREMIKKNQADGWIYYDFDKYNRYLPGDHDWYQRAQAKVKYIQRQLNSRWQPGGRID